MEPPRPDASSKTESHPLIHEDETSFRQPLDEAIESCVRAFKDASRKVHGAEARTRAALRDLKDLDTFAARVAERARTRTFGDLPGLKRGHERLPGLHSLTVGPWRGIFLVDAEQDNVIALVFSRSPHTLENRLDEIVAGYRGARDATAKPPKN